MWVPEKQSHYERKGARYPSDLSDAEWSLIGPGRRREVDVRGIFFRRMHSMSQLEGSDTQKCQNIYSMSPQIVNSSFSSELYLKYLILLDNGDGPHGHDLAKLFDQPSNQKNIIELK